MPEQNKTQEEIRWEDYLRERSILLARSEHQTGQADKYTLLAAAAAFGMMVTFFDKIIPVKDANLTCLYIASLLLLVFSVCAILYSFRASAHEANKAIQAFDDAFNKGQNICEAHQKSRSFRSDLIEWLNKWSLIAMIIAILLLVIFVIVNLNHN